MLLRIIILLLLAALPELANAGPPFITDDPEPVDYLHWEINAYADGSHTQGESSGALPGFDINYGLLPNVQIHITPLMAYDKVNLGHFQYGYGDTELGLKYRFITPGEGDWFPQVALYPLLEIPTGSAPRGLGTTGEARQFLPLWLQKDFGAWTAYGGGGYWHNPGDGNKDYWFAGAVLQRKITERLTLGGEFFHQTADTITATPYHQGSSGFNFGGSYDVTETYHLLFSAGQGADQVEATNQFSYYLALQITF